MSPIIHFQSKVYSNSGESVFLDFVYDITVNAIFRENTRDLRCDKSLDTTFDATLYERINTKLEDDFNCTVPFLPEFISKYSQNTTPICREANTSISAFKLYDYLRSSGQSTLCDSPCAGMEIFLGVPFVSTEKDSTWAYIKIYLKSAVKTKSAVLDYTFLSLVAEVGGYVGLLLGVSVVKIAVNLNTFCAQYFQRRWIESGKGK